MTLLNIREKKENEEWFPNALPHNKAKDDGDYMSIRGLLRRIEDYGLKPRHWGKKRN